MTFLQFSFVSVCLILMLVVIFVVQKDFRRLWNIYSGPMHGIDPKMTPIVDRRRPDTITENWHAALINDRHTSNIAAGYPPYHELNSRILRLEDPERDRTQKDEKC